jgi:cytochrome P450 family 9
VIVKSQYPGASRMFYIVVGVLLGVFIYFKVVKPARYWEKRNVTHEPSWPIGGNMASSILRKKHLVHIITDLYQKHHDKR